MHLIYEIQARFWRTFPRLFCFVFDVLQAVSIVFKWENINHHASLIFLTSAYSFFTSSRLFTHLKQRFGHKDHYAVRDATFFTTGMKVWTSYHLALLVGSQNRTLWTWNNISVWLCYRFTVSWYNYVLRVFFLHIELPCHYYEMQSRKKKQKQNKKQKHKALRKETPKSAI